MYSLLIKLRISACSSGLQASVYLSLDLLQSPLDSVLITLPCPLSRPLDSTLLLLPPYAC